MDKGVRIKITHDRLWELGSMYGELMRHYEPKTAHEELLLAHMRAMHHRLKLMFVKENAAYTLVLNDMEALAFMQTWAEETYEPTDWGCIIIKSITDSISKRFQQLKGIGS